jgi:hypothetical protein
MIANRAPRGSSKTNVSDQEGSEDNVEEEIDDLEAPAQQQSDVAGGAGCGKPSMVCHEPTCDATRALCTNFSHLVEVFEQ